MGTRPLQSRKSWRTMLFLFNKVYDRNIFIGGSVVPIKQLSICQFLELQTNIFHYLFVESDGKRKITEIIMDFLVYI